MTKTTHGARWPLAEAKSRLSEVVDRATKQGPQQITRHGKPAAVVVSIRAWRRLTERKQDLVAFLREGLADLDLARDQDRGREPRL
jgi:prevent-host-death family protein